MLATATSSNESLRQCKHYGMTMGILGELADFFPDTLVVNDWTTDEEGEWASSGADVSLSCYISQKSRLVIDASGREVVSAFKVTVASTTDLTVDEHRYTLPSRFDPRDDLTAISVKKVSDEDGSHHHVLMFPPLGR